MNADNLIKLENNLAILYGREALPTIEKLKPEIQKWKDKIWSLSNKNQYMTDRDHTSRHDIPVTVTRDAAKYPNANYNHVRHNPWLFAFHSRAVSYTHLTLPTKA